MLIAVLQVSMFGLTLHHLKAQKNDGLVINLAGRQRMLSKKFLPSTRSMYYHTSGGQHAAMSHKIRVNKQ